MLKLSCKDIGISHCDYVASGENVHEVLEQMIGHIEDHHIEEWEHREERMEDIETERDYLVRHIKDEDRSPA